jgi:hypothetical protein
MASKNAENVAKKVLESLGKGKKINLGKIARESGYSNNTADNPKNITETKTYQDTVQPFIDKMIKERDRIIDAMTKKDLDTVQYDSLNRGLDTLTKNIQLLNGGKTESNEMIIKWQ